MNLPALTHDGAATMSSLDIAEITGKNHADVLRDIRMTLGQAEIDASKFAGVYTGGNGESRPCFNLPRRECDLVVSGYSVKYRLAIIDRWHQLEAGQALAIPSHSEALRLAADAIDKADALALEVADLKPKAEFHDAVMASDDVTQLAIACQVLEFPFGRNTLFQRLRNKGVLISGGERHNLPKQRYIEQGLFTVKESSYLDEDKQVHVRFTTYATQKGLDWLMREFQTKQLETA
jgi:phage antirepressor YoqD-like protein